MLTGREEYYRWFEQIGNMNANVIRVYTLHPPGFYEALHRYNENHDEPIYLFHGVWIDEAPLEESLDAFDETITENFQEEMKKIIDVVHGNKIVPHEPGHASGIYRADISDYIIGWILGIEWYPFMVENMTIVHEGMADYDGTYFKTENAEPFEIWLAQQMDVLTEYEMDHYQVIRPMSFTNWPTTDILEHPSDSTDNEDIASVDPNTIYTKGLANETGQFASYHVYPYYPDFLNYDEKYRTFIDHRGELNNYAGYLRELNESHRLPILIAEFGIPASRGLTHENIFGWNQGFMSEMEQGEIVSRLFEDILEEGLLGGLIFTWQDEWFKRTWNTMDYDNPDRRPYWSNHQTNEQQFGLLSFDRHKIQVDGQINEWEAPKIYEKENGTLNSLALDYDEGYLYIHLHLNSDEGYPLILLDTVPNQGNDHIEFIDELTMQNGVEFIVNLNRDEPRILIDRYYDFFTYHYVYLLDMIKDGKEAPINNSGDFIPIHYALDREYYNPELDEWYEFKTYEAGRLREGNGNPDSDEYDSLADFYVSEDGHLELRIPWLLIQAKDPSQREMTGNLYVDGFDASQFVDEISVGVLYVNENNEIIDTFPELNDMTLEPLRSFKWETWDMPLYSERLKQSYEIIKNTFADVK